MYRKTRLDDRVVNPDYTPYQPYANKFTTILDLAKDGRIQIRQLDIASYARPRYGAVFDVRRDHTGKITGYSYWDIRKRDFLKLRDQGISEIS